MYVYVRVYIYIYIYFIFSKYRVLEYPLYTQVVIMGTSIKCQQPLLRVPPRVRRNRIAAAKQQPERNPVVGVFDEWGIGYADGMPGSVLGHVSAEGSCLEVHGSFSAEL